MAPNESKTIQTTIDYVYRQHTSLQGGRHVAGRLGTQGDRNRRARDARPDGRAPQVRPRKAAARRARDGFAAHDHPDRRADRDARGAGRRGALVFVQHLLDAGPRRRRHRRRGCAGLRMEGRDAARILVVHGDGALVPRRPGPAADRRRRRRRHAADPQGIQGRGRCRDARLRTRIVRGGGDPRYAAARAGRGRRQVAPHGGRVEGRERGDHHGGAPALPHARGGRTARAGDQRQRLVHQVEVRQPLRLPRIASWARGARVRCVRTAPA